MVVPALLFLAAAFLFAGGGFGGGSSYLAILSWWDWEPRAMTAAALLCNIAVTAQGTLVFRSAIRIPWRAAVPLLAGSLPSAFAGGLFRLAPDTWRILLAGALILSALALLAPREGDGTSLAHCGEARLWAWACPLGAALGCLAGLVGIGGGIFLAPLMHLARQGTAREIAALASVFILANSCAGLAGHWAREGGLMADGRVGILIAAVLLGGFAGSRLASGLLAHARLRDWTAGLVLLSGIRALWSALS